MRININNSIGCIGKTPVFGRSLTSEELIEYKKTLSEAKEKVGNDGKSILIVHDACLPQSADRNTGVGTLGAKKSLQFFDFMKNYLGINSVEILPSGEVAPYQDGRFFCAYNSSALSLSPHQINLELLTTPEYGNLISQDDIAKVVNANTMDKKEFLVNFENVVNKNSPFDEVLKKAFLKFRANNCPSEIRREFFKYVNENKDWLEPKGLFLALSDEYRHPYWRNWSAQDKDLLIDKRGFAQTRKNLLLTKYREKIEFYYFKQFLADKHLVYARKNLNEKGLKLIGDCLISFSEDERWAYQAAFNHRYSVGWGLPALRYDSILDEKSPASALLKKKVQLFAKRYDSIRFDVSWAYVKPNLTPCDSKDVPYPYDTDFGSKLLDRIDDYVREVKGQDFDVKELIHEFDASPEVFPMTETTPNGQRWRAPLMDRTKALGTTYMSQDWGQNQHYLYLNDGKPNFVLGAGNHDPQPLRQIAYGMPDINGEVYKPRQVDYLSDFFRVDKNVLENPIEFIKAKFAELLTAKNNQFFYIDVFGEERRFDSQIQNTPENYRLKLPENFERHYFNAVESGHGFNPMDALAKVFKQKGLDLSHQDLYARIIKYRDILLEKTIETSNEVLKEVMELPKTQNLVQNIEKVVAVAVETTAKETVQSASKSKRFIGAVITGTVGAVAGGVTYFFSKKKEIN